MFFDCAVESAGTEAGLAIPIVQSNVEMPVLTTASGRILMPGMTLIPLAIMVGMSDTFFLLKWRTEAM